MAQFKNIVVVADHMMDVPNLYPEDAEVLSKLVAEGWEIKTCTHFLDLHGNIHFLVLLTKN
jgi:hypothetical protein